MDYVTYLTSFKDAQSSLIYFLSLEAGIDLFYF